MCAQPTSLVTKREDKTDARVTFFVKSGEHAKRKTERKLKFRAASPKSIGKDHKMLGERLLEQETAKSELNS